MTRRLHILLAAILFTGITPVTAYAASHKGEAFFYRIGEWVDNFQLRGLDTAYIGLPEHSWHLALTNGEVGIHNMYTTWVDPGTPVSLLSQTTPGIELGFNVGYRGYGGGYSWDLYNAYTTHWNLSLGSKYIGIEFIRNVSTNLTGKFLVNGAEDPNLPMLNKGEFRIANTSLTAWYALNSAHYSHNAAIKQSYIQKRTAGSLLLSVAYKTSEFSVLDSAKYIKDEDVISLVDGVTGMITRQVAVGIGYGINYTPNHGVVLLHAAANMQVVCYSVNHISYVVPSDVYLPGEPQFVLRPAAPVYITGNMRAAISWEINRWVHLSAGVKAQHLRFASKAGDLSTLAIKNWHWQAHLNIGVRFGAGKKRVRQVLDEQLETPETPETNALSPEPEKKSKMPKWITDFFFSASH